MNNNEIHFQVDTENIPEVKELLINLFRLYVKSDASAPPISNYGYQYLQFDTTRRNGLWDITHHPVPYRHNFIPVIGVTEAIQRFKNYKKFIPVTYKLSDGSVAEIQQDGSVKVGCQTFTKENIIGLAEEVRKIYSYY